MKAKGAYQKRETVRWVSLIACVIGLAAAGSAKARVFTSTDGKKLNGKVVSVAGEDVVIRIGTKNFTVPISRFVEADRKYIAEWNVKAQKNLIPKFDVRISTGSSDRSDKNDDFDNSVGHFKFTIEIENEERGYNLANATGTLIVLGEDCEYDDQYAVMEKTTVKVNIADGETWKWNGKKVNYRFDDSVPSLWGYKYYGYIFAVKNEAGKIIFLKASPKKFEGFADQGLKLQHRDLTDRTLKRKGRASSSYF